MSRINGYIAPFQDCQTMFNPCFQELFMGKTIIFDDFSRRCWPAPSGKCPPSKLASGVSWTRPWPISSSSRTSAPRAPKRWREASWGPSSNEGVPRAWHLAVSMGAPPVLIWLVVWTPLKNISQLGWLFPIYGKIKNVPNHQPVILISRWDCHGPLNQPANLGIPKNDELVG